MSGPEPQAAGVLLVCPHCGFQDSGRFCSNCGGALALATGASISLREIVRHTPYADKVHLLPAWVMTTYLLFGRPADFFREVLLHEPPAQYGARPVNRAHVCAPVPYVVITVTLWVFVAAFPKIGLAAPRLPLPEAFAPAASLFVEPALFVGVLAIVAARWAITLPLAWHRITPGEAAVFWTYSTCLWPAAMLCILPLGIINQTWVGIVAAPLVLWGAFFSVWLAPIIVLPRLYSISYVRAACMSIVPGLLGTLVLEWLRVV